MDRVVKFLYTYNTCIDTHNNTFFIRVIIITKTVQYSLMLLVKWCVENHTFGMPTTQQPSRNGIYNIQNITKQPGHIHSKLVTLHTCSIQGTGMFDNCFSLLLCILDHICIQLNIDYPDLVYPAPRLSRPCLSGNSIVRTLPDSSNALVRMRRGWGQLAFGGVVIIDGWC